MGGARGLNYAYDYRRVDGIMVPVTRGVVAVDDNKRKIPDPVLVAMTSARLLLVRYKLREVEWQ